MARVRSFPLRFNYRVLGLGMYRPDAKLTGTFHSVRLESERYFGLKKVFCFLLHHTFSSLRGGRWAFMSGFRQSLLRRTVSPGWTSISLRFGPWPANGPTLILE